MSPIPEFYDPMDIHDYMYRPGMYYSDDPKKYHTVHHAVNMFDLLYFYSMSLAYEFSGFDSHRLKEAIAWHDSVYVPGSKTNEEDSVELYKSNGGDDPVVIEAILSTKIGNKEFKNSVEMILHDLDWSGFIDYDTMCNNEKKIIYECTFDGRYTEAEAMEGQIKFYKSIVNDPIYVTKTFKVYNDIARGNIKRRLAELTGERE